MNLQSKNELQYAYIHEHGLRIILYIRGTEKRVILSPTPRSLNLNR